MANVMTTRELAEEFGVDEKTVRIFLREVTPKEKHPGFGKKWEVRSTQASMRKLKNQYKIWSEHHTRLLEHHSQAS